LRGCGFEIGAFLTTFAEDSAVSVPLRGCGFEILS